MARLTMSGLPRAFRCLGSVTLPQIQADTEDGQKGTEIHDLVEGALVGDIRCLAECSERNIDLDKINAWLPAGGAEPLLIEPKVAYDVRRCAARRIDLPGPRNYGACGPDEIPGSGDLALWHGGTLYLGDIKTGFHQDTLAGPAAENWQLRGLALGLWWARPEDMPAGGVRAALIHIRADGSVWIDEVCWGPWDLHEFALELERLWDRLDAPSPTVRTSSYCSYCPAILACPATVQAVQLLAPPPVRLALQGPSVEDAEDVARFIQTLGRGKEPAPVPHTASLEIAPIDPITAEPAEVAGAFGAWRHLKKIGDAVEKRARLLAEQGQLPGYALEIGTRREIDGGIAHAVLKALHGPEVAKAGVEIATSRERITAALRAARDLQIAAALPADASEQDVAAARKTFRGWLAREERAVMAAIAARDGITVKEHKQLVAIDEPAPALPPAEGAQEP